METANKSEIPVLPVEGLHLVHAFYRIDRAAWFDLDEYRRAEFGKQFEECVEAIRQLPEMQCVVMSIVSPKADMAILLAGKDLHMVDRCQKQLQQSLGPDMLSVVYSYLSMTERSEYTTSEEEYAQILQVEEGLVVGSPAFEEKIAAFRQRMEKYSKDRLDPKFPEWPVICFYPMLKRRDPGQNWYALSYEDRKRLMGGHARVGRGFAGRVIQVISGSTGLDDWEWGVTLFAKTASDVKDIVYQMRFDEVSAQYAEFGEFYIGLPLPVSELLERLGL